MTDLAGLIMNDEMSELLQEAQRRKQVATSAKSKSGSGGPGSSKTSSKTEKPAAAKDVEYGGGGKAGEGEGGIMPRTGVGERPSVSGRRAFLDRDIHGAGRKTRAQFDEEARAADWDWDARSPGRPDGMPMAASPDIRSAGQDAAAPRKGFVGSRGTSSVEAEDDTPVTDETKTSANEDQGVLDWITSKVFGDLDGDDEGGTTTEGRNKGRARNRTTPAPDGAPSSVPSTDPSRQRRGVGERPSAALPPAPQEMDQRVVGQKYKTPDGRVVEWTGAGWKLINE